MRQLLRQLMRQQRQNHASDHRLRRQSKLLRQLLLKPALKLLKDLMFSEYLLKLLENLGLPVEITTEVYGFGVSNQPVKRGVFRVLFPALRGFRRFKTPRARPPHQTYRSKATPF